MQGRLHCDKQPEAQGRAAHNQARNRARKPLYHTGLLLCSTLLIEYALFSCSGECIKRRKVRWEERVEPKLSEQWQKDRVRNVRAEVSRNGRNVGNSSVVMPNFKCSDCFSINRQHQSEVDVGDRVFHSIATDKNMSWTENPVVMFELLMM